MKRLRRVTEAEVISEFLKNEFYREEFHRDRAKFESLVLDADITREDENLLRRALLFRRRGHMWRELPSDTQWWEVELDPEDLGKLRVFPRAQWRKVADGSFALRDIVQRIRNGKFSTKVDDFISKVHSLSYQLRFGHDVSSVIIIGEHDDSMKTILEGNHRLTAAMLAAPQSLHTHFRIFFGMSLRMDEVCWHHSSLRNLARYVKNRLKHLGHDEDADLRRLPIPDQAVIPTTSSYAKAVGKALPESK